MNVTQISIGRFHHFHLARQLEKHNLLNAIWTGYPAFKLKDETGIPLEKIHTFPWLQAPFMMRGKFGLENIKWLNKLWAWQASETLDKHVASQIKEPTTLVALSSMGLHAGVKAKKTGGNYICDRGSSHIKFQNRALTEEYKKWGFEFVGIDPRVIAKEESEYEACDLITVPSEFVRNSFVEMGVSASKIKKVTYGARLDRFSKVGEPDPNHFKILWVGGVSIRKGFMYLLEAFQNFSHPSKELIVVGGVSPEIKQLLVGQNLDHIRFMGQIQNAELPFLYSSASVFVLPSIEEGLAMVQGEALSCGCPVIATKNAGGEDLFDDGVEGFIVPVRSAKAITEKFYQLADHPEARARMSNAGILKVKSIGGWDTYGNAYAKVVESLYINNYSK